MRNAALLLFVLLAACGQSGDLYLPVEQPPPAPQPESAPTAPAPTEEEKKKEAP